MVANYLIDNYKFKSAYNNYFSDLSNKFDLNNIDVNIILFLYNNPKFNNAKDIVRIRGLAKSNVSTSLAKLEKRRIVFYKSDDSDKRKINIFLNNEFEAMFEELKNRQNKFFSIMLDGLSEEEIEIMNKTISKLISNIDSLEE